MISKKMSNIEQKVFATQKNVDSMQKVTAEKADSFNASKKVKSPPRRGV